MAMAERMVKGWLMALSSIDGFVASGNPQVYRFRWNRSRMAKSGDRAMTSVCDAGLDLVVIRRARSSAMIPMPTTRRAFDRLENMALDSDDVFASVPTLASRLDLEWLAASVPPTLACRASNGSQRPMER